MSREAKAAAVKRLRDAGDVRLARRIQETKVGNGVLTAEDVDHLAANFARSESRRIFYDAHERQNYALALRAVMPFAQATFNTIRRWGELSMKNPQLMYRTLKPLNYATQAGSASIYGALGSIYGAAGDLYDPASYGYSTADTRHNSVDGFFYTDSNGDRKFAYPIVGLLGGLIGAPEGVIPSSSLSGLNVAGTTIFPGFGPAITLPASFSPQLHQALASDGAVGRWRASSSRTALRRATRPRRCSVPSPRRGQPGGERRGRAGHGREPRREDHADADPGRRLRPVELRRPGPTVG